MYYVYVIKSIKDGKIYVGHTNNLTKRYKQHNQGLVKATNSRKPFRLLYYEACNILKDATSREKSLKTGFGRAYLKRRLSDIETSS
jgi:putative endonuclease